MRKIIFGVIIVFVSFVAVQEYIFPQESKEAELGSSSEASGKQEEWKKKTQDELYINELYEEITELKKDYTYTQIINNKIYVQKEGAKDNGVGEMGFEYDKSFEKVIKVDAHITLADGKKYKYSKKQDLAMYYEEPLYSNSRVVMISMPNVVPESTIEWEVKSKYFKPYIKDVFAYQFYLSDMVPVRKQMIKMIVPNSMTIRIENINTDLKPVIEHRKGKDIYTWEKEYIEKIEKEDNMPDSDEVFEQAGISTMQSWAEVDVWYWGLVNKNIKISDGMKETVKKLAADKPTQEEKIQAIIKYIQENFRYVSMSFGYNNFEPHPTDELFANKYGDCKDQTLVGAALLKEIGINAYVCLFRGQKKGDIKDRLPMPWYFNHAILGIEFENKMYYTDVLIKGYKFTEIQESIQGAYLFVINGKGGYMTSLPILKPDENVMQYKKACNIKNDGSASVQSEIEYPRSYSESIRENWKNYTEKERKENLEQYEMNTARGGKIIEHKLDNIDVEYSHIKRILNYEDPQFAEAAGDYLIFGLGGIGRYDKFTKNERTYDIFFRESEEHRSDAIYIIPAKYRVVNLPKPINIKTEFEEFERNYKQDGNKIIETQIVRKTRAKLPKEAYKRVQDYCNQLSNITKERIIIKRID